MFSRFSFRWRSPSSSSSASRSSWFRTCTSWSSARRTSTRSAPAARPSSTSSSGQKPCKQLLLRCRSNAQALPAAEPCWRLQFLATLVTEWCCWHMFGYLCCLEVSGSCRIDPLLLLLSALCCCLFGKMSPSNKINTSGSKNVMPKPAAMHSKLFHVVYNSTQVKLIIVSCTKSKTYVRNERSTIVNWCAILS